VEKALLKTCGKVEWRDLHNRLHSKISGFSTATMFYNLMKPIRIGVFFSFHQSLLLLIISF
jgi:hypothetical protein